MANCEKCACEGAKEYKLITVRTMTVHEGRKTKRYQAMGEFFRMPLCDSCIDAYIESRKNAKKQVRKALIVPCLLFVLAVALLLLNLGDAAWLGAALCAGFGAVVLATDLKKVKTETAAIREGSGIYTRPHMIEELVSTLKPKKHNDAALTYLLADRVLDKKQIPGLAKEYRISTKKLESIRTYLLGHKEEELNAYLDTSPATADDKTQVKGRGLFRRRK
jgi:hypothetical protein